jgi:hypothetical protein
LRHAYRALPEHAQTLVEGAAFTAQHGEYALVENNNLPYRGPQDMIDDMASMFRVYREKFRDPYNLAKKGKPPKLGLLSPIMRPHCIRSLSGPARSTMAIPASSAGPM